MKGTASVVSAGILLKRSAMTAHAVRIFIKDRVVCLRKHEKESYDGVMDTIEWKKKRLRRRKAPKGFEGW